mmetsp:Transcript_16124/g.45643  ORF Transcript_16124/g.45643 Transcript_16124/m.45643 type:complete len:229 (+) Transcript_16124:717-1403(+)
MTWTSSETLPVPRRPQLRPGRELQQARKWISWACTARRRRPGLQVGSSSLSSLRLTVLEWVMRSWQAEEPTRGSMTHSWHCNSRCRVVCPSGREWCRRQRSNKTTTSKCSSSSRGSPATSPSSRSTRWRSKRTPPSAAAPRSASTFACTTFTLSAAARLTPPSCSFTRACTSSAPCPMTVAALWPYPPARAPSLSSLGCSTLVTTSVSSSRRCSTSAWPTFGPTGSFL